MPTKLSIKDASGKPVVFDASLDDTIDSLEPLLESKLKKKGPFTFYHIDTTIAVKGSLPLSAAVHKDDYTDKTNAEPSGSAEEILALDLQFIGNKSFENALQVNLLGDQGKSRAKEEVTGKILFKENEARGQSKQFNGTMSPEMLNAILQNGR